MKNTIYISIFFCYALVNSAIGQDPQFSQYYANPLYLNPAFAGNSFCPKLSLSYRNQWAGLGGGFKTYSFAFDKYIEGVSGGIGALLTQDKSGAGGLTTTTFNLMYAYTITINKALSFKAGMQLGYFQHSINWNELKFADMYDGSSGGFKQTSEIQNMSLGRGMDVAAGGILYSEKVFGGVAVHHLTEPEQSLFGYEDSKLKRRITVHAGANFEIESVIGEFTVSPNLLLEKQHNFYQYNLGCYVERNAFVIGGWYRWKDAVMVLIGIDYNNLRIGYSFDYTTSKLGASKPLGSHEISCTYKFKCSPVKRKKYRTAACPQF
ncbi:MAG: type IX secretion system membrane protein PorP/SprF [Flavobacteriales bacterium]|nr:type IX secretion system membrane protein PorP/SprF [Flavobacteriales bacterium]